MSFFGDYVRGNFSSCRHIATAYDEHRKREVKIYFIPGEFEYVGVFDGTDGWIAPVIADPFSVDIKRTLLDIRENKPITTPLKRKELAVELLQPITTKRVRHVLQTRI